MSSLSVLANVYINVVKSVEEAYIRARLMAKSRSARYGGRLAAANYQLIKTGLVKATVCQRPFIEP